MTEDDSPDYAALDEALRGTCGHLLDPDDCVYCSPRFANGPMEVIPCTACKVATWHHEKLCLQCGARADGPVWLGR